jgi:hypothetical protein
MMAVLLGTGIGLLLAGLAAIVYGIPVKEFSFGNTMILSGVVASCSGLIMLGLWVMTRELQNVARRLGGGISVAPQTGLALEPSLAPTAPRGAGDTAGALFSRDQPPGEIFSGAEPPPWPAEAAALEMAPPPPAEPVPPKPKRNLLFSTSSRKERERAAARTSEPLAPDLLSADLRPPPSASPPPAPEAAEPPPATFEDAWPKPERGRSGEAPPLPPRRSRAPSAYADANGAAAVPPREATPQVTVLKSGVVDGMAYSLYSDGSIEAQMPEGMMRFASIDELRAHLDQRP